MADRPSTEALINELYARGVRHLRTAEPLPPTGRLDTETLIAGLARDPDPRVRETLIPFFINHPATAKYVPGLFTNLEQKAARTLAYFYTATAYLQRLWQGVLTVYLGAHQHLPDYFGLTVFNLPAEDGHFGELNLRHLADQMENETGYTWLSLFESAMKLTLDQLELQFERQTH
jgi:hypothetical protein